MTKNQKLNLTMEISGKHYLNQVTKLNITNYRTIKELLTLTIYSS